jgi:outer membrane protein assembly factor BamB
MGHLAAPGKLAEAWTANIGEGGGYRRKITAQPIIAGGRVFTMDSDAVISAFDARTGERAWDLETQAEDDRSTNVGGGVAFDGGVLYAATGRGDVLAIEPATSKIKWRKSIGTAARAAPTIAEGKLFVPTLDDQLVTLSANDGTKQWSYQATNAQTTVLGLPSAAYADGLVIAGFGSGDLVALRAASGSVSWTDSLASVRGRNSLVDLSAITGLPVVQDGRVYAVGLGGLMVSIDLRSGRRLWEREVASAETPWLAGDWLFVLATDGHLAAITRADGTVAWVSQLPRFEDEEDQKHPIRWTGPVLAGNRLIVASSNAKLLAVSPTDGKTLTDQEIPGAAPLAPSVAGGTVFLVTNDATLLALR